MAGFPKYRNALTPDQQASADYIMPYMHKAVKQAEGDKTGKLGVRSIQTDNPDQVLDNSIVNNFSRWVQGREPGKFVDFMQKKWAPIGAENDPKGLNKNWAGNVRNSLKQQLGSEEYDRWSRYNMVELPPDQQVPDPTTSLGARG